MDIHDPPGPAEAHVGGNHLHVAGEDNEIGLVFRPKRFHFLKRFGFGVRRDRDVVEGDAFAFDEVSVGLVVGDDAGDVEGEFAGAPAPEDVSEAVTKFGHHQDHARTSGC